MSQIVIVGQFDIEATDAPATAQLMKTMMEATVRETGCLHYAFSSDLSTPHRFQLSELWENDESLAAHFQTAHMATFRAGMAQQRVHKRTVTRYQVTSLAPL